MTHLPIGVIQLDSIGGIVCNAGLTKYPYVFHLPPPTSFFLKAFCIRSHFVPLLNSGNCSPDKHRSCFFLFQAFLASKNLKVCFPYQPRKDFTKRIPIFPASSESFHPPSVKSLKRFYLLGARVEVFHLFAPIQIIGHPSRGWRFRDETTAGQGILRSQADLRDAIARWTHRGEMEIDLTRFFVEGIDKPKRANAHRECDSNICFCKNPGYVLRFLYSNDPKGFHGTRYPWIRQTSRGWLTIKLAMVTWPLPESQSQNGFGVDVFKWWRFWFGGPFCWCGNLQVFFIKLQIETFAVLHILSNTLWSIFIQFGTVVACGMKNMFFYAINMIFRKGFPSTANVASIFFPMGFSVRMGILKLPGGPRIQFLQNSKI